MEIFVKTLAGKTITVKVDPYDTLNVLRAKIQDQERIVHRGQPLEGNRALVDYDIFDGSTLDLDLCLQPERTGRCERVRLQLNMLDGSATVLDLRSSDTVDTIKGIIQETEGIPRDRQRLIHDGKYLWGGTLAELGIRTGTSIFVVVDV